MLKAIIGRSTQTSRISVWEVEVKGPRYSAKPSPFGAGFRVHDEPSTLYRQPKSEVRVASSGYVIVPRTKRQEWCSKQTQAFHASSCSAACRPLLFAGDERDDTPLQLDKIRRYLQARGPSPRPVPPSLSPICSQSMRACHARAKIAVCEYEHALNIAPCSRLLALMYCDMGTSC